MSICYPMVIPAAAAAGGFTFIAAASVGSSDGNPPTTAAINTTGANLLVVAISSLNPANAASDNKSNIWLPLTVSTQGNVNIKIFYCVPTSVGTGHTVTCNIATTYPTIIFAAFSGGAASPFDVQAGGNGISATPSTSGITPGFDNELIITAAGSDASTLTEPAGYNILDTSIAYAAAAHFAGAMAYKIQTTATPADPDWSLGGSAAWACRIASFTVP